MNHIVRWLLIIVSLAGSWACQRGYRADSLAVTELVRGFVSQHGISGSDMDIVQAILEVIHDPALFIRIERPMMKTWIRDASLAERFQESMAEKQARLDALQDKTRKSILSVAEVQERRELLRETYFGRHNLRVYNDLLRSKRMLPEDLAFVVSGDEAIRHRVRDGCTTMAHVFICLAKAAGIEDVRFLVGANVSEIRQACSPAGGCRDESVEIDGHMVAVVKIDERWAIVNCTYLEPYSDDPAVRYEILTSFEGQAILPESLVGKVLRFPSYQREGFPPRELLVAGVGSDPDDDLDVENHSALMNLSVSGDPGNPTCRWSLATMKEERSPVEEAP